MDICKKILQAPMNRDFQLLSNLVYGTNWSTIRVRVGRLWTLLSNTTNEPYALNMQLLDVEGNQKMGSVRKHVLGQFEDTFREEGIYDITRFNIQNSDPSYKAIDEDWTIVIRTDTQVTEVINIDVDIPRYKFSFIDETVLPSRVGKKLQLTDVGGLLKSVTDIFQVTKRDGTHSFKRELRVHTFSGNVAVVSLWSEKKNLVNETVAENFDRAVPIVVTSTTVEIYGRSFTFYSTKATKVYLNIKIPQIEEFVLNNVDSASTKITVLTDNSTVIRSDDITVVESTIAHLMQELKSSNCRGKKHVVPAKITKVRSGITWSYLSCVICKGSVRLECANYICTKCHTMIDSPLNRYRLNIEILDKTMSTTITAFDKEAEGLIGQGVDDMIAVAKMENGSAKVDNIFQKIVGTDVIFEFRPTNYEMNNTSTFLTARRITKKNNEPDSVVVLSQTSLTTDYTASSKSDSTGTDQHHSGIHDLKGKAVLQQVIGNGATNAKTDSTHFFKPAQSVLHKGIIIQRIQRIMDHISS